jgi:hypothetical protein
MFIVQLLSDYQSDAEDFQLPEHRDSMIQTLNQPIHAYVVAKIPSGDHENLPEVQQYNGSIYLGS